MLMTGLTVVRREGHHQVHRTVRVEIAQIVQGALTAFVAGGAMATTRAWGLFRVAAVTSHLGCGEILDVDNPLGGVWHVTPGSKHG
jgi:hypothetical protein